MADEYRILNLNEYYRKGVYEHFSKDCKCSVSMTCKVDVTRLVEYSKQTNTKFYVNFLYCLTRALNTRDDYKMVYRWQTEDILVYDRLNIAHYVFDEKTETCTPVYTEYTEDYAAFYAQCTADIAEAKQKGGYNLDMANHPNYYDASYLPWLSYESLNVELPDGYLWFQPITNWGRYEENNGRLNMPLTVRLNHAIADGYLVSKVFLTLREVIEEFCRQA